MRDLDKIKAREVYKFDRARLSVVLFASVASGIVVFLVGLVLGIRKPHSAEASTTELLDNLILSSTSSTTNADDKIEVNGGGMNMTGSGEAVINGYINPEGKKESITPPLVPADSDAPLLPELPEEEGFDIVKSGSYMVKIPKSPSGVAFEESERSPIALRGERGIFTLHVSSFHSKMEAAGYVSQLRRMGYRAFLVKVNSEERGTLYRVRIGPFFSKNEAERYRKEFEKKEGIPTYVVKRILK